jgi:hypothetical protein
MVTLEESAQVPLVIFHLKTFAPVPKAVTVVVGLVGVVIVPLPLTNDQVPVPTEGVFAAMVAVAHTVWFGPAFAVVTLASMVMIRLFERVVGVQLAAPAVSSVMVSFTV